MYLEKEKCAQCGRTLPDSSRYAPHNTELDGFGERVIRRPLFCSPRCVDNAAEQYADTSQSRADSTYENARKDFAAYQVERLERELDVLNEDPQRDAGAIVANIKKQVDIKEDLKEDLRTSERNRVDTALFHGKQLFFSAYSEARQKYEAANEPPPRPPLQIPPARITQEVRSYHTHLLGPSGSGKTTVIEQLLLNDLSTENPPAIILIDPKGFLIDRIARLNYFHPQNGPLRDRLVLIDLRHKPAPPLNLFSKALDATAINYAVKTFDYLFAQAGAELSPFMRPAFRFCARLMFSLPEPDILLFLELLESEPNDPRFQPYIDLLIDVGAKRFFQKEFYTVRYQPTRQQIKARFQDILSMTELLAAFTSPSPPLDIGKCLRERKILLVNTCRATIDPDQSQLLGRYIINATLGAALARGLEGPQAFLFIDEFQDFVDEHATDEQLRLAREYKIGMLCAHQNMYCKEINENLRAAISGNTTLKLCSNVSGADHSYMLREFGCDSTFLDKHYNDREKKMVKFAALIPGSPPFSIALKYPRITPDEQMSDAEFTAVLRRNQAVLHPASAKPLTPPQPAPTSAPTPSPPSPPKNTPSRQPPPADEAEKW